MIKLHTIAEHLSKHGTKYGVAAALATAGGIGIYKVTLEWVEFYNEHVAPQMNTTE